MRSRPFLWKRVQMFNIRVCQPCYLEKCIVDWVSVFFKISTIYTMLSLKTVVVGEGKTKERGGGNASVIHTSDGEVSEL